MIFSIIKVLSIYLSFIFEKPAFFLGNPDVHEYLLTEKSNAVIHALIIQYPSMTYDDTRRAAAGVLHNDIPLTDIEKTCLFLTGANDFFIEQTAKRQIINHASHNYSLYTYNFSC